MTTSVNSDRNTNATYVSTCSKCGHQLPSADALCRNCIVRSGASQLEGWVSGFVQAAGRTRKAGCWLLGGGVAVMLSAFMPWVSIDGVVSSHPSGTGLFLLLVIGAAYAYFGSRVLQNRVGPQTNVALWVVSGIDVLLSVGILVGAGQANREIPGLVSVSPSLGFFVGLAGLAAGVAGTAMLQLVRGRRQGNGSGH